MFASVVRSACKQSFGQACDETEVGRHSLPPLLAPEPRPLALAPQTRPRHANRTPSWTSDLCGRYFAWNWTIPVDMLAVIVNNYNIVIKLVQECKFFMHFTSVLRKQFAVSYGSERLQPSTRNKKMLYTSIWLTLHHLSADCYCLLVIIIYAQADSKHWVLHSSRIVLPLSGMALVCQPLLNICYDSEGRNVFSFNCSCKFSCVTMQVYNTG